MSPIIVTGAGSGIGHAVTRQLLDEGKTVVAVGRNEQNLRKAFSEDANCVVYICDLSNETETINLIKAVKAEHGRIGGIVHCAGHDKMSPLYLNKQTDVEELFRIHTYAAINLCKLVSKKETAAAGCSVVLVSSLSAHEGAAGHTAYAAAKGALEGFLPSAACEMAGRGIRLNEVVLGVIKTEMSSAWIEKLSEEKKNALDSSYPLGLGTPEDAAEIICFLLSEKAKWITGQKFIADGGHMVRQA